MSVPQLHEERNCLECGATLKPEADRCWLCKAVTEPAGTGPAAGAAARVSTHAVVPAGAERRAAFQFSLASLMLIVTLVAVLLSVFQMAPGLGVVLLIVSGPAVIRTCMVTYRRKEKGQSVSPVEKAGMYLGSVFVGLAILVALVLASFGTFFAVCAGIFAIGGTVEDAALPIAAFAALIVTGLVCWPISRWVRRRWRKAVDEKNNDAL